MIQLNSHGWSASHLRPRMISPRPQPARIAQQPLRFGNETPKISNDTLVLFLNIWTKAHQIPAPVIDKNAVMNGVSAVNKPGSAKATFVDQAMADGLGGTIMNEITNTPVPVHGGDFVMEYGPGDKYVSCAEQIINTYTFKDGSPLKDKDGKLLIKPGEPTDLIKQQVEVRAIIPSASHTHVLTQECMQKAIAEGRPPEGEVLRPNHIIITNLDGFPYQQTAEWFLKRMVPMGKDSRHQKFFDAVKVLREKADKAAAAEAEQAVEQKVEVPVKKWFQPELPFPAEAPEMPQGFHMATDMTWRMIQKSTKMFAGPEEPPTWLTPEKTFTDDPAKGTRLKGVWATPYRGGTMNFLNDPKNEWWDPHLCHSNTFPSAASGFIIMLLNAVQKAKSQIAWNGEVREKIRKEGAEQHTPEPEIESKLAEVKDPTEIVLLNIKTKPTDNILVRDNIHVFNENPDQHQFFASARPFSPQENLLNQGKLPEFIFLEDVPIVENKPGQPPETRITKTFSWSLKEAESMVNAYLKPKSNPIRCQNELFTTVATENGIEYRVNGQSEDTQ